MNKRNYKWYNNGNIEGKFAECPAGWNIGRLPVSEETKEKNRQSQYKRYKDVEERKKTSQIMKEYYEKNPEKKKQISEKLKIKYENEDMRKYISRCVKKFYDGNKSVREKLSKIMSDKMKKYYEKEESHEVQRKAQKLFCLNNPEFKRNPEILQKRYNTLQKNNSFNTSKFEEEAYKLLVDKFGDVKRQYKSEKYPFSCDFYIPSLDLYIECQGSWTHGDEPFDENNKEHLNRVKLWKEKSKEINFKNKKKDFYEKAIQVWTIRDVNKRKIAKENGINYLEFFSIDDIVKWINER